jgi:hypothetical protein
MTHSCLTESVLSEAHGAHGEELDKRRTLQLLVLWAVYYKFDEVVCGYFCA